MQCLSTPLCFKSQHLYEYVWNSSISSYYLFACVIVLTPQKSSSPWCSVNLWFHCKGLAPIVSYSEYSALNDDIYVQLSPTFPPKTCAPLLLPTTGISPALLHPAVVNFHLLRHHPNLVSPACASKLKPLTVQNPESLLAELPNPVLPPAALSGRLSSARSSDACLSPQNTPYPNNTNPPFPICPLTKALKILSLFYFGPPQFSGPKGKLVSCFQLPDTPKQNGELCTLPKREPNQEKTLKRRVLSWGGGQLFESLEWFFFLTDELELTPLFICDVFFCLVQTQNHLSVFFSWSQTILLLVLPLLFPHLLEPIWGSLISFLPPLNLLHPCQSTTSINCWGYFYSLSIILQAVYINLNHFLCIEFLFFLFVSYFYSYIPSKQYYLTSFKIYMHQLHLSQRTLVSSPPQKNSLNSVLAHLGDFSIYSTQSFFNYRAHPKDLNFGLRCDSPFLALQPTGCCKWPGLCQGKGMASAREKGMASSWEKGMASARGNILPLLEERSFVRYSKGQAFSRAVWNFTVQAFSRAEARPFLSTSVSVTSISTHNSCASLDIPLLKNNLYKYHCCFNVFQSQFSLSNFIQT
ncbi:hypothetical protein VP01_969g2 [Puccinia sorghi]|uniref:Uncharacterized protein n=1 Tax=Puccinia sorghi TaxID=27349 RepID=A0A0L6U603_9BASI|nr:hypothetical protein VP01_969g2 [Puccinia sorghi]